jgi:voltage-gated sodium channel
LSIFCIELFLRLYVQGCAFFYNDEWGWNWFDFFVVALGVVDQWLLSLLFTEMKGSSNMSNIISSLRVIRLLRVLRAFRLFQHFRPLRLLAKGLIGSLSSVFWIAMMFLSLVFTSAIFTTSLIGRDADSFSEPEKIRGWFGTMGRSMETLSIFLTCDDWSTPVRIVNARYPWMEIFWVWYIVTGAFLVLSLLTGLMADNMKEARDEDEDESKTQPDAFAQLLTDMRIGDHEVSSHEFADLIVKPKVSKALAEAGLRDMTRTSGLGCSRPSTGTEAAPSLGVS